MFTTNTNDVHTSSERIQLEAFLDTYRRLLNNSLEGLTEEEARRRLVPSDTTLLGLVKHAIFVEQIWFNEAITGTPRQELGLPATSDGSFVLTENDTIATIRETHRQTCLASVEAVSQLTLDDVVTGHHLGPLSLRWIYLHTIGEFAQHCGHADILREQILAQQASQ